MDRVYTFERLLLSRAKSECASACSKEVKILYSGHFSLIWQVLFPSEELYLYCLSVAESKKTVATCDRRGFPIIQGTSSLSSHWMQQTSTFWQFPLTNEFKSSLEAGNKFFVVKKSGKIRKRLSTQVGGGRAFAEKKKCLFFRCSCSDHGEPRLRRRRRQVVLGSHVVLVLLHGDAREAVVEHRRHLVVGVRQPGQNNGRGREGFLKIMSLIRSYREDSSWLQPNFSMRSNLKVRFRLSSSMYVTAAM